ncbi:translation elongation factor 2 (EF-2/EF-G) [Austwickia chelonae]|uniref:Elongation factor G n=1 Tax=Austwickia chelonae NBRC 105200 TaxID=1184607 RepID=K6VQ91_9MICO|nr:elongation factor G-like protein EF-G2 [Austwickia chelonae]GAB77510.1 elongation factor G [Austwickia chelonae NBRC 105200]SEW11794.1 translation elongation factor 2 (EF-2/EF-G) [Austwickia chelonae]
MSGRQSTITSSPVASSSDALRNVVLVGPSGSGKTRLFDHLLATTTPGYRPPARGDERSTQLSVAAVDSGDVIINLIDTPGYSDFVGDLRAGLRAADAALFVVSAADGVDAGTRRLWHECANVDMPRAVAITKLDAGRGDFESVLTECQEAFGDGVLPLGIPQLGSGGSLDATIDLVLGEVHDYTGHDRVVRPTGPEHADLFDTYQGPLMEGIIQEAEDDTLLDRYLEGEQIGFEVVEAALLKAVAHATFFPVLPLSVATGAGIDVLLHLIEHAFPPPSLHPLPRVFTTQGADGPLLTADPDGPLVAEVVKTTSDAYVGAVALVRVFSGTLHPDSSVHVSGHLESLSGRAIEGHHDHDEDVKVGPLSSPLGETLRPKESAIAGDLAIVAKLPTAQTSDTISDKDMPLVMEPWDMPDALLPIAVRAATRADEDKLPAALQRLSAGDPSLRVEHNAETSQVVLWTMGQTHADMVMDRLKDKLNVDVTVEPLRIALRETFLTGSSGHGRHVKQSGGHGQFAVCDIKVEPNERGAGFEFIDKVVGGAVPRQFIPSVEKGVRAQLEKGCVAGYPMVDVKVTLFDGKAHSVDSSDAAFQMAGALALKEAAAQSGATTLLEPIDLLTVTVADDYVGAVMTDLQGRRGRLQGSEPGTQEGTSVIKAEVPQVELSRYAIDLRSLAHGAGTFTRQMVGYEQMPGNLVKERVSTS